MGTGFSLSGASRNAGRTVNWSPKPENYIFGWYGFWVGPPIDLICSRILIQIGCQYFVIWTWRKSQRTHREKFYEVEEVDLALDEHNRQLERWKYVYNYIKPHQSLDYLTQMNTIKTSLTIKNECVTNVFGLPPVTWTYRKV